MYKTLDSSQKVRRLALVRALVAGLGERLTPPWWRSQFLTDVGLRGTSKIFPRTVTSTAISSTVIGARGDHDKRIGVGRRYHLFRLPADLEPLVVDTIKTDSFSAEAASLLGRPSNALMTALAALAEGGEAKPSEGPIGLGAPERILEGQGVAEMAAYYHMAIETGHRIFPYFEEKEKGY